MIMFCKQRILMTCYCCTLCRGTQRKSDGYWFKKNLEIWEELGVFSTLLYESTLIILALVKEDTYGQNKLHQCQRLFHIMSPISG